MKVAAFQAPLDACHISVAIPLIREQIARCEALNVEILCCPEAILGGLADYSRDPTAIAINSSNGQLHDVLASFANDHVTTIVGFSEIDHTGRLYNAAAVYHHGSVLGIYRKHHPAIRRSVYAAGHETPVFRVGGLTFGIVICLDSIFPEPAGAMIAQGATVIFIPTNNGLPPDKGGPELIAEVRNSDMARAARDGISIIRADVAGQHSGFTSSGSTGIVDRNGRVLAVARPFEIDLIIADIDITSKDLRNTPSCKFE